MAADEVAAPTKAVAAPEGATVKAGNAAESAKVKEVKQLALAKDVASAKDLAAAMADADPIVRRLAIYGLERIGDPANAPKILPVLKDSDLWVRRTAICALGKLGNREAAPALVELLKDPNLLIRLDAFVALSRIGDPSTQKPIIEAMKDKALWTGLSTWDWMSVLHVIERNWFTDKDVVPVLKWLLTYGEWAPPQKNEEVEGRRDENIRRMGNAVGEILARKFGDASGEDFLVAGLAGDNHMQQTSAMAVGLLKSKKAIPGLLKILRDELDDSGWVNNKLYAIAALGEIGEKDPAAVEMLKKMAAHEDIGIRAAAYSALTKIGEKVEKPDLTAPAAVIPQIAAEELKTPGNKRPPMFIVLGVDDCANVEGVESMLDIVETLHQNGSKAVFTMWLAPLAGDWEASDLVKKKLIYQRLFDLGSEIAHHTLHHNPGGKNWGSLPREVQVVEVEGCTQWYRDNIDGFTRPFSHKGGGGGQGARVDPQFTAELLAKQKFLYGGGRGGHPNDVMWPPQVTEFYRLQGGVLDGNAPPVHEKITRPIASDYPGLFDYPLEQGVAMMKANFEYRYNHPRRPVFAVNAFHDWGFKVDSDSTSKFTHRMQGPILKAFLMDVLVKNKDKYPDTYCVTFRQVVEYVRSGGDLEHTLKAGNCQDSRNPEKPLIP
jgi:HEAT repeat protein